MAGAGPLVRMGVHSFDIHATNFNCSNNYRPYQHLKRFIQR